MIKVKVIKPFYYAEGKELYVDEDRYNELEKLELVQKIETVEYAMQKQDKVETAIKNKTIEIIEGLNKKGGLNTSVLDVIMPPPASIKKQ